MQHTDIPQPKSATLGLQPVARKLLLIARPTEGRRLSWPDLWVSEIIWKQFSGYQTPAQKAQRPIVITVVQLNILPFCDQCVNKPWGWWTQPGHPCLLCTRSLVSMSRGWSCLTIKCLRSMQPSPCYHGNRQWRQTAALTRWVMRHSLPVSYYTFMAFKLSSVFWCSWLDGRLGPDFQKNLKICLKIFLRCVLSLSYDIDWRSAKIVLRFF